MSLLCYNVDSTLCNCVNKASVKPSCYCFFYVWLFVCVYVVFPTCVSLGVTTEGPLRRPMTPVFSPVSMPGGSPLLRYTLHVVVVCSSFVSVAAPRPAVAQRRGRALHGAAVIDGLREKETDHRGRERESCRGFL